jgi:NitT/TauT family transport system ATP-binding protein
VAELSKTVAAGPAEQGPAAAKHEAWTPKVEPVPVEPTVATRPPVVQFKKVNKEFGKGDQRTLALSEVSFVVEDLEGHGEFIAILGPSGCGKSTLIRILAGLAPHYPQTSGEVLVLGKPVLGPGADRGMVFQDYSAYPNRTVLGNVELGLELRGMAAKERRDVAREWVAKVGLAGHESKYPHELSGGMRQRVAIARTLVLQPRIILMDEPFGALDPGIRYQMQELLVRLWRELQATVFFITHSITEAAYLGDRVYIMKANPGRLVEEVLLPRPEEPPLVVEGREDFRAVVAMLKAKVHG